MDELAQKAIGEALKGNWEEAERINEGILKDAPEDKEALNRFGRAAAELGKVAKAISTYKKVLRLDPYNSIAQKSIVKLSKIKRRGRPRKIASGVGAASGGVLGPKLPNLFIEEPGKTKTVTLIHLGSEQLLHTLDAGEVVFLVGHRHRISVETGDRKYIGRLPDDISRRLIKFLRLGVMYEAVTRSVNKEGVRVFIRESERPKSAGTNLSFPISEKKEYVSFTPPELVYTEGPETETTEGAEG